MPRAVMMTDRIQHTELWDGGALQAWRSSNHEEMFHGVCSGEAASSKKCMSGPTCNAISTSGIMNSSRKLTSPTPDALGAMTPGCHGAEPPHGFQDAGNRATTGFPHREVFSSSHTSDFLDDIASVIAADTRLPEGRHGGEGFPGRKAKTRSRSASPRPSCVSSRTRSVSPRPGLVSTLETSNSHLNTKKDNTKGFQHNNNFTHRYNNNYNTHNRSNDNDDNRVYSPAYLTHSDSNNVDHCTSVVSPNNAERIIQAVSKTSTVTFSSARQNSRSRSPKPSARNVFNSQSPSSPCPSPEPKTIASKVKAVSRTPPPHLYTSCTSLVEKTGQISLEDDLPLCDETTRDGRTTPFSTGADGAACGLGHAGLASKVAAHERHRRGRSASPVPRSESYSRRKQTSPSPVSGFGPMSCESGPSGGERGGGGGEEGTRHRAREDDVERDDISVDGEGGYEEEICSLELQGESIQSWDDLGEDELRSKGSRSRGRPRSVPVRRPDRPPPIKAKVKDIIGQGQSQIPANMVRELFSSSGQTPVADQLQKPIPVHLEPTGHNQFVLKLCTTTQPAYMSSSPTTVTSPSCSNHQLTGLRDIVAVSNGMDCTSSCNRKGTTGRRVSPSSAGTHGASSTRVPSPATTRRPSPTSERVRPTTPTGSAGLSPSRSSANNIPALEMLAPMQVNAVSSSYSSAATTPLAAGAGNYVTSSCQRGTETAWNCYRHPSAASPASSGRSPLGTSSSAMSPVHGVASRVSEPSVVTNDTRSSRSNLSNQADTPTGSPPPTPYEMSVGISVDGPLFYSRNHRHRQGPYSTLEPQQQQQQQNQQFLLLQHTQQQQQIQQQLPLQHTQQQQQIQQQLPLQHTQQHQQIKQQLSLQHTQPHQQTKQQLPLQHTQPHQQTKQQLPLQHTQPHQQTKQQLPLPDTQLPQNQFREELYLPPVNPPSYPDILDILFSPKDEVQHLQYPYYDNQGIQLPQTCPPDRMYEAHRVPSQASCGPNQICQSPISSETGPSTVPCPSTPFSSQSQNYIAQCSQTSRPAIPAGELTTQHSQEPPPQIGQWEITPTGFATANHKELGAPHEMPLTNSGPNQRLANGYKEISRARSSHRPYPCGVPPSSSPSSGPGTVLGLSGTPVTVEATQAKRKVARKVSPSGSSVSQDGQMRFNAQGDTLVASHISSKLNKGQVEVLPPGRCGPGLPTGTQACPGSSASASAGPNYDYTDTRTNSSAMTSRHQAPLGPGHFQSPAFMNNPLQQMGAQVIDNSNPGAGHQNYPAQPYGDRFTTPFRNLYADPVQPNQKVSSGHAPPPVSALPPDLAPPAVSGPEQIRPCLLDVQSWLDNQPSITSIVEDPLASLPSDFQSDLLSPEPGTNALNNEKASVCGNNGPYGLQQPSPMVQSISNAHGEFQDILAVLTASARGPPPPNGVTVNKQNSPANASDHYSPKAETQACIGHMPVCSSVQSKQGNLPNSLQGDHQLLPIPSTFDLFAYCQSLDKESLERLRREKTSLDEYMLSVESGSGELIWNQAQCAGDKTRAPNTSAGQASGARNRSNASCSKDEGKGDTPTGFDRTAPVPLMELSHKDVTDYLDDDILEEFLNRMASSESQNQQENVAGAHPSSSSISCKAMVANQQNTAPHYMSPRHLGSDPLQVMSSAPHATAPAQLQHPQHVQNLPFSAAPTMVSTQHHNLEGPRQTLVPNNSTLQTPPHIQSHFTAGNVPSCAAAQLGSRVNLKTVGAPPTHQNFACPIPRLPRENIQPSNHGINAPLSGVSNQSMSQQIFPISANSGMDFSEPRGPPSDIEMTSSSLTDQRPSGAGCGFSGQDEIKLPSHSAGALNEIGNMPCRFPPEDNLAFHARQQFEQQQQQQNRPHHHQQYWGQNQRQQQQQQQQQRHQHQQPQHQQHQQIQRHHTTFALPKDLCEDEKEFRIGVSGTQSNDRLFEWIQQQQNQQQDNNKMSMEGSLIFANLRQEKIDGQGAPFLQHQEMSTSGHPHQAEQAHRIEILQFQQQHQQNHDQPEVETAGHGPKLTKEALRDLQRSLSQKQSGGQRPDNNRGSNSNLSQGSHFQSRGGGTSNHYPTSNSGVRDTPMRTDVSDSQYNANATCQARPNSASLCHQNSVVSQQNIPTNFTGSWDPQVLEFLNMRPSDIPENIEDVASCRVSGRGISPCRSSRGQSSHAHQQTTQVTRHTVPQHTSSGNLHALSTQQEYTIAQGHPDGRRQTSPSPSSRRSGRCSPSPNPLCGRGENRSPSPRPSSSRGEHRPPSPRPSSSRGEHRPPSPRPSSSRGEHRPPSPRPSNSRGEHRPPSPSPSSSRGEHRPPSPCPSSSRGEPRPSPTQQSSGRASGQSEHRSLSPRPPNGRSERRSPSPNPMRRSSQASEHQKISRRTLQWLQDQQQNQSQKLQQQLYQQIQHQNQLQRNQQQMQQQARSRRQEKAPRPLSDENIIPRGAPDIPHQSSKGQKPASKNSLAARERMGMNSSSHLTTSRLVAKEAPTPQGRAIGSQGAVGALTLSSGSDAGRIVVPGDSDVSGMSVEITGSLSSGQTSSSLQGETELHLLSQVDEIPPDVLRKIVEANLQRIDDRGCRGETPLFLAVKCRKLDVARFLLHHKANPNILCPSESRGSSVEQTCLHEAVTTGDRDMVKMLLTAGHNTAVDLPRSGTGITPLMLALDLHMHERKGREIVKLLIEHGASLSAEDSTGHTPMMFAVQSGDVLLVKYMLKEAGADGARDLVTMATRRGMTCLHFAAQLRNVADEEKRRLMRDLIQAGANPSHRNNEGDSARDWDRTNIEAVLTDLRR